MKQIKRLIAYFTVWERVLWCASVALILASFFLFGNEGYLTLAASLLGVTSLILCAKGNPLGQLLMVIFSILYGVISFEKRYYGEMITYVGMSGPMALFSLIAWLRNPFNGNRGEVKVKRLRRYEAVVICILTVAVTAAFYFILKYFGTASLEISTLSVATSFFAVSLTLLRSPYFALAYATNDVVLIVLWSVAALYDVSSLSVIVCFAVFLANDLYGFFNWRKMQKRQEKNACPNSYS